MPIGAARLCHSFESLNMILAQYVDVERKVVLELRDGAAVGVNVALDPESARTVAGNLMRLADIAEGALPPRINVKSGGKPE